MAALIAQLLSPSSRYYGRSLLFQHAFYRFLILTLAEIASRFSNAKRAVCEEVFAG
jgi:hypothetical protein